MAIKHKVLNHGMRYFFRIHEEKTALLNNGFSELKNYLERVFEGCHDQIFLEGARASGLKFSKEIELTRVEGHAVCDLAKLGLSNYTRFKTAHSKVQLCMLENDSQTVAVEVPIWLKQNDLVGEDIDDELFLKLFLEGTLTGHIDIVSFDGSNIWVWDYKPGADKEKYAATQVYFYALMLSKRTGIPLEKFRCGYFDEKVAYLFKP